MVSFHQVLAERPRAEVPITELEVSSKKRKWEEPLITEEFFKDHSTIIESNPQKRKSIFDIELHLETPFPSNKLQQYLSIQSGINLCNTRVKNMKTPESKISPEPESPLSCGQMSLDLELNLTSCESLRKKEEYCYCDINEKKSSTSSSGSPAMSLLCESDNLLINQSSSNNNKKDSSFSSSWGLITTIDQVGDDHKEMVATVCMRCHMLVMLCKSSPSCPNCKFMHPPDQNPSFLMMKRSRRCSLLC